MGAERWVSGYPMLFDIFGLKNLINCLNTVDSTVQTYLGDA